MSSYRRRQRRTHVDVDGQCSPARRTAALAGRTGSWLWVQESLCQIRAAAAGCLRPHPVLGVRGTQARAKHHVTR